MTIQDAMQQPNISTSHSTDTKPTIRTMANCSQWLLLWWCVGKACNARFHPAVQTDFNVNLCHQPSKSAFWMPYTEYIGVSVDDCSSTEKTPIAVAWLHISMRHARYDVALHLNYLIMNRHLGGFESTTIYTYTSHIHLATEGASNKAFIS